MKKSTTDDDRTQPDEGDDGPKRRHAVSLRPRDFVADEDTRPPSLQDIRAFRLTGERDSRLPLTLPLDVCRGLETLKLLVGRVTMGHVAQWALNRGLMRLERHLGDIRNVIEARAVLLRLGDENIAQLDQWAYHVAARDGGQQRLFLRNVAPSDAGRCKDTGTGLGLSTSTVAALAIMAALLDTRLPGTLPETYGIELQAFHRALRRRAALARQLRTQAEAVAVAPELVRWGDVFPED